MIVRILTLYLNAIQAAVLTDDNGRSAGIRVLNVDGVLQFFYITKHTISPFLCILCRDACLGAHSKRAVKANSVLFVQIGCHAGQNVVK
nr:MAG TPA: hypothetical protein [Caudoviricetes sp.]